jgi:hypothetical protein
MTRRRSPAAASHLRRDTPLRRARTCYDHLAGVAGVGLLHVMLARGWLVPARGGYRLSARGVDALLRRGVDLVGAHDARRRFAFGCQDWTERRPHLGGALGAAVLGALVRAGVVRRRRGTRVVTLGRSLGRWLGAAARPVPRRGGRRKRTVYTG